MNVVCNADSLDLCRIRCTGTGVSPSILVFPVSIVPIILHTSLYLRAALQRGRIPGTFRKSTAFSEGTRDSGERWLEKYFLCFLGDKYNHPVVAIGGKLLLTVGYKLGNCTPV